MDGRSCDQFYFSSGAINDRADFRAIDGESPVRMRKQCTGREDHLRDCQNRDISTTTCDESDNAVIICQGPDKQKCSWD